MFNELPDGMKSLNSLGSFKNSLKNTYQQLGVLVSSNQVICYMYIYQALICC